LVEGGRRRRRREGEGGGKEVGGGGRRRKGRKKRKKEGGMRRRRKVRRKREGAWLGPWAKIIRGSEFQEKKSPPCSRAFSRSTLNLISRLHKISGFGVAPSRYWDNMGSKTSVQYSFSKETTWNPSGRKEGAGRREEEGGRGRKEGRRRCALPVLGQHGLEGFRPVLFFKRDYLWRQGGRRTEGEGGREGSEDRGGGGREEGGKKELRPLGTGTTRARRLPSSVVSFETWDCKKEGGRRRNGTRNGGRRMDKGGEEKKHTRKGIWRCWQTLVTYLRSSFPVQWPVSSSSDQFAMCRPSTSYPSGCQKTRKEETHLFFEKVGRNRGVHSS
jgi:hypothetical protein